MDGMPSCPVALRHVDGVLHGALEERLHAVGFVEETLKVARAMKGVGNHVDVLALAPVPLSTAAMCRTLSCSAFVFSATRAGTEVYMLRTPVSTFSSVIFLVACISAWRPRPGRVSWASSAFFSSSSSSRSSFSHPSCSAADFSAPSSSLASSSCATHTLVGLEGDGVGARLLLAHSSLERLRHLPLDRTRRLRGLVAASLDLLLEQADIVGELLHELPLLAELLRRRRERALGQCLAKGRKVTLTVESVTALNLHTAPTDASNPQEDAAREETSAQPPQRQGAARRQRATGTSGRGPTRGLTSRGGGTTTAGRAQEAPRLPVRH